MGANTDKFIKANDAFATTLATAIADGSTTASFDLALEPEDITDGEAVLLFIDRVNSSGVKTPGFKEVIIGIKNGVTISSTVRGVEGSGQAHSIGAVVEIILAATMWNRLIEGILAEHEQDGTHSAGAIDAITEIASGLKTGIDTKLVTGTPGTNGYVSTWNGDGDLVDGYQVLDEDNMASDSATAIPTQQSTKAYVDTEVAAIGSGIPDSVAYQANTTNSTKNDVIVKMGWGFVTGTGSTIRDNKAISFASAFPNEILSVQITYEGLKTASDPTALTDFANTDSSNITSAKVFAPATTGFTAEIISGANLVSGTRYGYSWIAWGR